MAGDPKWESVWQAAAATDRSGALALVATAIGIVLAGFAAAVWARASRARARKPDATGQQGAMVDGAPPMPG